MDAAYGQTNVELRRENRRRSRGEAKYRLVFDDALDGVLLTAPCGSVAHANPAACELFGMSEEALVRGGWAGIVDPDEPETAHHDLDSFALSVAHDVCGPLIAIGNFGTVLEEREASRISDKGLHYVRRIRAATRSMRDMTDALLKLARLSHEALQREEVDLAPIAARLLADMQDRSPAHRVEVRVAPRITAWADPALVTRLLEHLISNAWKFSARRDCAAIEVGVAARPGADRAFFVKDNGVGFRLEEASDLFRVFSRLHAGAGYEGTGAGLATVHKIVTRHDGKVWAEAAPGEGATFFFTLGA